MPPLRCAAVLAVLALGFRAVDPAEWPFPFHPTVQYESALAARAVWLTLDPSQRTPERADWFADGPFHHVVSPPLLPGLVAGVYLAAGDEVPWASKVFAGLFWVGAGWLVMLAVNRQTGSRWAGVVALGWFALCPYGLMVSRSFQTESVLACGYAAAVWLLSRPGRSLAWRETLLSGLVCGLLAAAKPGVVLPPLALGFAAVVLTVPGRPGRKLLHLALFTVLLALPSVVYVKLVLSGRGGELQPGLLLEWWFYSGVATRTRVAVGLIPLAIGLVGVGLAAWHRVLLPAGLTAGHLGTCAVFTYHCATHDYYHVPLLVPVAVGLGWAAWAVEQRVGPAVVGRPRRLLVVALAAVAVAAYLRLSRSPVVGPWRYAPAVRAAVAGVEAEQAGRAGLYREAAAATGPGAKVVAVTEEYGYPLEYHTGLRPLAWPRAVDLPAMTRAGMLPAPFAAADYLAGLAARGYTFAVVTDFAELDRQPDLRAALAAGRVVLDRPGLLVVDLRPPGP